MEKIEQEHRVPWNPEGFSTRQYMTIRDGKLKDLGIKGVKSIHQKAVKFGLNELATFCEEIIEQRKADKQQRDDDKQASYLARRRGLDDKRVIIDGTDGKVTGDYTKRQLSIISGDIPEDQIRSSDYVAIYKKAVTKNDTELAEKMLALIEEKDSQYWEKSKQRLQNRHTKDYDPEAPLPPYIQKILSGETDPSKYSKRALYKIKAILRAHHIDTQFLEPAEIIPLHPKSRKRKRPVDTEEHQQAIEVLKQLSWYQVFPENENGNKEGTP